MQQIILNDTTLSVIYGRYTANNQLAIMLVDAETGEPYTDVTKCSAGDTFAPNVTAIKNYSENEGILEALVEAGVVEVTGRSIPVVFTSLDVVKVLWPMAQGKEYWFFGSGFHEELRDGFTGEVVKLHSDGSADVLAVESGRTQCFCFALGQGAGTMDYREQK